MEHKEAEEHGRDDIEPVIVRKTNQNENLAKEMAASGIQCEALAIGSHPIERQPTSSHMFSQTSRLTTNKGLIRVLGRNIDFVQVIQRF